MGEASALVDVAAAAPVPLASLSLSFAAFLPCFLLPCLPSLGESFASAQPHHNGGT